MMDAQDGPRPCGAIHSASGLVLGLVWGGQRGLACPWGHSLEPQTPRRGRQQEAGRWGRYENCPLEEWVGPQWVRGRLGECGEPQRVQTLHLPRAAADFQRDLLAA